MPANEERWNKSLIDLARLIMADERKVMNFNDIFNRVADLKGLTEEQRKQKIAQFYTDLNMDGHFVTTGANNWGLKGWERGQRLKRSETVDHIAEELSGEEESYEVLNEQTMTDRSTDELDDDLYEYDESTD